jgi:UPF0755 protein
MKRIGILFILIFLVVVGVVIWWQNGLSPVNSRDRSQKMFVVPQGAGIRAIANDLKEEGLIKDDVVFFLHVRLNGIDKKIQAGSFRLSPSMPAEQIAKNLTVGTLDIWVTIPEGKRAEEVAELLSERLPNYDASWVTRLKENEGYLFPETYLIPKDADIDTVISLLRNTFDVRYADVQNNTSLSQEEIVTLASMIEREARHAEDRPMVSSVMHNRLAEGMALDIDATIQYAKGKVGNKWWAPVTLEEYRSVKSPYNTYLQPGLPPGPIASPGIESLKAAANPADTEYLFYITDKDGINRYARDNAEHDANKRRYGLSE